MNEKVSKRTKYAYSVGGIGRDMAYTLVSMYILVFFTDAVGLPNWEIWAATTVIAVARIWDAINDPMMGIIIDNTKSKWGKFKPWILIGALTSAIFIFMLFIDYGVRGIPFVVIFASIYLLLEITFTMNDISYWSMYPSFTTNPKERESIGSLARFFASLGGFIAAGLIPPIYQNLFGTPIKAFFWLAIIISIVFVLSQLLVVYGVKENHFANTEVKQEKTKWKDIIKIIIKNDQLMIMFISFFLFETCFSITIALGPYFFNYDLVKYGGIEYTLFLVILAASQLLSIGLYSFVSKYLSRRKIFFYSTILIVLGYVVFLGTGNLFPENMNLVIITIAGFLLFAGQGFIQVLVYVMIADTIEYGHWKLGTRNESVVFAIRPFATKFAASISAIALAAALTQSGINEYVANKVVDLQNSNVTNDFIREQIQIFLGEATRDGYNPRFVLRIYMMVIPLIIMIFSYIVYRYFYKIDDNFYKKIIDDLEKRKKEVEVS